MCGSILGEGEDRGHGAGHGGREAGGQILVQGRVPKACGDTAMRSDRAEEETGPQAGTDHHAHQVRNTGSVTRCHLYHRRLLCTNPAEQGGPSVRLLGSIAFESITCCLAETYDGGSGFT